MKILVIEDEYNVSSFIHQGLEENGYAVLVAYKGNSGWQLLQENEVDLIILDLILPDINGVELCQHLREKFGHTYKILMLTALNTTDHIVEGLGAGADDYLGKPFEFKELLARIQALTRRDQDTGSNIIYKYRNLEMNDNTKEVTRDGHPIKLTPKEYKLLAFFLSNKERVIGRSELLENIWEIDFDLGTNVVDVYVNYLRNKVDKGFEEKLIHTIIGMGYIFKGGENDHQT